MMRLTGLCIIACDKMENRSLVVTNGEEFFFFFEKKKKTVE